MTKPVYKLLANLNGQNIKALDTAKFHTDSRLEPFNNRLIIVSHRVISHINQIKYAGKPYVYIQSKLKLLAK